ncbi:MAG: hypothetical protein AYK19_04675 [Theionarchaea archaeon DG-70-1]|nr:MAG: hypothetical protein AYK19_04675 [Theionarchaea archaeon DG-70-1]
MTRTSLLPPLTAVQIVWARTGLFSKEKHSPFPGLLSEGAKKNAETKSEKALKILINSAGDNPKEKEYVVRVMAAMDASLRSIHTAYNGRNLNFDENKKLREAYLENINESMSYGFKLKDILRGLPTISLGGLGGYILTETLFFEPIVEWFIIVVSLLIGYFSGWAIIVFKGRKMQKLYIRQEYERTIYFCRYVEQVADILEFLYEEVHRIHEEVFDSPYFEEEEYKASAKKEAESEIIKKMLKGMLPKSCEYVHGHLQNGKITSELWPICETGRTKIIEKHCEQCNDQKRKRNVPELSKDWSHLY